MYSIQNRQKRTWTIPPVHAKEAGAAELFKPVNINPGESVLVDEAHWDSVKAGNRVIEALLTGRHLVVTRAGKVAEVEPEELANPKSPEAPEELSERDERLKLETKTEMVEVALKDDAPREGKGRK